MRHYPGLTLADLEAMTTRDYDVFVDQMEAHIAAVERGRH